MNIIEKKDRRLSHLIFTDFFQKFQISITLNKKANKIRTNLLLFANNEFNEYKKKDNLKVNHLCIIDSEKKYYKNNYIRLKPKIYSRFNLSMRGEGGMKLNLFEKPNTFIMKPEFSPDKIYGKVFKRKSLAERKILRFHKIINENQDLNLSKSTIDEPLLLSTSIISPKILNHSNLNHGLSYLRELAFSFKDTRKKKRRNSLFYNKKNNIDDIVFSLIKIK